MPCRGRRSAGAPPLQLRVQDLVPDCRDELAILEETVVRLVATDAEIAVLDSMQYLADGRLGSGARAAAGRGNGAEVLDEEEWRIFALASAASAVASTLTMPIVTNGQVVGSVNLYAGSGLAFTDVHEQLAESWAPTRLARSRTPTCPSQAEARGGCPVRFRDRALFETV